MFEMPLPAFRKYQRISAVAGGLGFVIGVLVPAYAIFISNWRCPFGDGLLQVCGFLGVVGVVSGIVVGNLAALIVIRVAKSRQPSVNADVVRKPVHASAVRKPHLPGRGKNEKRNSTKRKRGVNV